MHFGTGQARRLMNMVCYIVVKHADHLLRLSTGNVSEALQNLMMQHADARTFLRHYLHRRVTADAAAIVRGLDPQESVMRSACNMSRWIDINRPWGLNAEQADSVNQDPTIVSLLQARESLRSRLKGRAAENPTYQKLNRRIANEKERLRRALLEEIQRQYELEDSVRSIENQLAGAKVKGAEKALTYFSKDTLPEQQRLIETLILAPPGATLEEEYSRRDDAVNAVVAYCKIEEGDMCGGRKRCGGRRTALAGAVKAEDPLVEQEDVLKIAMISLYVKDPAERPKRCAVCIANEKLPLNARLYEFSSSSDMSKHFKRKHLSRVDQGVEKPACKLCRVELDGQTHFRRHMFEIHGTVT